MYKKSFKVALLLLLCAVAFAMFYIDNNNSSNLQFETNSSRSARELAYVSGEVESPGVYPIEYDDRIFDLILKAGGLSQNADTNFVAKEMNLALKVKNEEKIFIPNVNEELLKSQNELEKSSTLISLNTADKVLLMTLPGIGESTADKIIQARPFTSLENLMDIPGIGEVKFNQLRSLVTL